MPLSEEVTAKFLDAAGDLLREVFEQFQRENAAQAVELSRRVAAGRPIAITVLADLNGPRSVRVVAPGDGGGTVEIAHLEGVRPSDH